MSRFWADNVTASLRAEELFPDKCHRVRYEDMVSDPEAVAAGIFSFLGVPPAPGVSANCLAPGRERFGPADYKIWHTSKITGDSVGRGWTIPAGLDRLDERFTSRWAPCADESFSIIILPAAKASPPVRWRVDLAARAVTAVAAADLAGDDDDGDDTAWDIIGPADVWDELLTGRLNFSVAMRRCQIRYLDTGEAPPAAHDTRIGMLTDLLGLTCW